MDPERLRQNFLHILQDKDRLPFGRFGLYFKDLVLEDGDYVNHNIPEEAKEVRNYMDIPVVFFNKFSLHYKHECSHQ